MLFCEVGYSRDLLDKLRLGHIALPLAH
jgi:hypothetical protein